MKSVHLGLFCITLILMIGITYFIPSYAYTMTGQVIAGSQVIQIKNPIMIYNQSRLNIQNFAVKQDLVMNQKFFPVNTNIIHISTVQPGFVVNQNNKEMALNKIIQNTIFPSSTPLTHNFVPTIVDEKWKSVYASTLTTPQEWPFSRGKNTTLLQPDDVVRDVIITIDNKNYTTSAIFDKNGTLKFEPILYFTPAKVTVTGSSDKLLVTDALGLPVISASLQTRVGTADGCSIDPSTINPDFTVSYVAPLWNLSNDPPTTMKPLPSKDSCSPIQNKKIECAATYTNVNYSTFWINFELDGGIPKATESNVPIGHGQEELLSTGCASYVKEEDQPYVIPEFPESAAIVLFVSLLSIFVFFSNQKLNFHN